MNLLRAEQVAEALGISRSTARRMMVEGVIPAVTLRGGRRKRIIRTPKSELERWLRAKLIEENGRKKQRARTLSPGVTPAIHVAEKN